MMLSALLTQVYAASPMDRIEFRDQIAAHGEDAIEPMTDWLGDPRLAAFAVRVLEGVGNDPANRADVVATLAAVDLEQLMHHQADDVRAALQHLGVGGKNGITKREQAALATRAVGLAGVDRRGYWMMRTSPARRDLIWSEATGGCLRQGWGWDDSQDLDVIAVAHRQGVQLNEEQQLAWRARKMRTTEPGGMRVGDLIVTPNLPAWGEISVFRLVGSYRWEPLDLGIEDRFGHVLPVELLAAGIDRRAAIVSDALRSMLRPQTRLYSIKSVGGDVEQLVASTG